MPHSVVAILSSEVAMPHSLVFTMLFLSTQHKPRSNGAEQSRTESSETMSEPKSTFIYLCNKHRGGGHLVSFLLQSGVQRQRRQGSKATPYRP